MTRYLLGRLASMVLVLVTSSVVAFAFLHLAPGDPAQIMLAGRPATPAALSAIRDKYGLNKPVVEQYFIWAGHILHGDLGQSIRGHASVASVLAPRIATTIELTLFAMVLILVFGLPLGILSAAARRRGTDALISTGSLIAASVPAYVSGILLIAIFAVKFPIFPVLGNGTGGWNTVYHLVLPAVALALFAVALVSRITRVSLIEAMAKEYVETARIRGFSGQRVLLKHALRSALVPIVTVSGVLIGSLLSGAILVEYTFGLNGIGALLVNSVQGLDYQVVQAIVLLITLEFVIVSLIVDLLYVIIDPRVRTAQAQT